MPSPASGSSSMPLPPLFAMMLPSARFTPPSSRLAPPKSADTNTPMPALPSAVPLTSTPIALPSRTLAKPDIRTPAPALPATMLRSSGVAPPTVLLSPLTSMPALGVVIPPFGMADEPLAPVPTQLPRIDEPEDVNSTRMPSAPLPETTLRSSGAPPPMMAPSDHTVMPSALLPSAAVPVASRPIQLPAMRQSMADTTIPLPSNPPMVMPRTSQPGASSSRPLTPGPAAEPLSATTGVPEKPGCKLASRMTGSMMTGSAV